MSRNNMSSVSKESMMLAARLALKRAKQEHAEKQQHIATLWEKLRALTALSNRDANTVRGFEQTLFEALLEVDNISDSKLLDISNFIDSKILHDEDYSADEPEDGDDIEDDEEKETMLRQPHTKASKTRHCAGCNLNIAKAVYNIHVRVCLADNDTLVECDECNEMFADHAALARHCKYRHAKNTKLKIKCARTVKQKECGANLKIGKVWRDGGRTGTNVLCARFKALKHDMESAKIVRCTKCGWLEPLITWQKKAENRDWKRMIEK